MKLPPPQNKRISDETDHFWKKRPSEIRGFQRTYYMTDDNRDYLRIDFNLRDKRVRLYVEAADEGGASFYSVIHDGRITVERSVLSGRSFGCSQKFIGRADLFASVPNKAVLKLIGSNYGIDEADKVQRQEEKKARLRKTQQRYFKTEDNPYERTGVLEGPSRIRFGLFDIIDTIIGLGAGGALFWYTFYDYILLGFFSAIYGVLIGLYDSFIREREPNLLKVMLFIVAGVGAYIYGYYLQ